MHRVNTGARPRPAGVGGWGVRSYMLYFVRFDPGFRFFPRETPRRNPALPFLRLGSGRGRRSLPRRTENKKNAQNSVVSHGERGAERRRGGGGVTDLVRLHVWVGREAELHYYS